MTKTIPNKWDLIATLRYKRENMERAMRGEIERGLVELITNSDDKYLELEEQGAQPSGKILIEIERRRTQPTIVIVRDRAVGMSRQELHEKMGGLGGRTSGSELGKKRRGLHGRGAKDIAAFGTVHFECIKDNEYNHLIIPPSLTCEFKGDKAVKATDEMRNRLGITKGNGTVVTLEVNKRFNVPQHGKLVEELSRYYSLRDIFSNPNREVTLRDMTQGRKDRLLYKYPAGEVIYDEEFLVPEYPDAKAHILIRKHETPFTRDNSAFREGILIKSGVAIHDCTHFGLETEPLAWHFTGELKCDYIDQLVLEYENREEKNPNTPNHPSNNPTRLLDPMRDGLIVEHPFVQKLYKKCSEILHPFIDELKKVEDSKKRNVVDENLNKKLDNLSKEVSKLFESKLRELEDDGFMTPITDAEIDKLGAGLHIIPEGGQKIIEGQSKTFSVIVKHYEALDPLLTVDVTSSNPQGISVRSPSIPFRSLSDDGTTARTTFTLDGLKRGAQAYIEARCGIYENLDKLIATVIAPPLPVQIPDGLTFDRAHYTLQMRKEKSITLRLKTKAKLSDVVLVELQSSHAQIVVKSGGKCELRKNGLPNVWTGTFKVEGRQLKAKGKVSAVIQNFESAEAQVIVEDHEPKSGILLKPPKPVEDDFRPLRYKWGERNDPLQLLIGASHPSIRRYLGEPQGSEYPGINNPLYHTVLAEVIAEALAFKILEKEFARKGREGGLLDFTTTELWFNKHFSEFLTIAHKCLVADSETTKSMSVEQEKKK